MLREPVQMIYAHYTQMRFNALGDEELTTFEEALAAEPARREGRQIPKHCTLASALLYRDIAQLADQTGAILCGFSKGAGPRSFSRGYENKWFALSTDTGIFRG